MSGGERLADQGDGAPVDSTPRDGAPGDDLAGTPEPPGGEQTGYEELGDETSPRGAPGDAESEGGVEEAEPVDELTVVTAERDEYLDALRRLQAEFDNYRKRTARQQTELLERGSEALIQRLLPALDALDLALAHVGERAGAGGNELDGAFVQIGNLLRDVLAKEGLERIDATGVPFDPTEHDAVAHVTADEADALVVAGPGVELTAGPAVVETLRAGYRLKGRVLRPAMVKVRA